MNTKELKNQMLKSGVSAFEDFKELSVQIALRVKDFDVEGLLLEIQDKIDYMNDLLEE